MKLRERGLKLKNLATPFKPAEKYGIASTAFAAIMATESEGVTKNLTNRGYTDITHKKLENI